MKKIKMYLLTILVFTFIIIIKNDVYATTSFNVKRKSMKIYDKFNLSSIITTDSNNLKYTSSDEDVAVISKDGEVFTKKQGQVVINVEDENSSDTCILSSGFYSGIDISSFNDVDWRKFKSEGLDFVMIRSSWGWYDEIEDADKEYEFQYDKKFLTHVKGASENGVSFGIYHYSYAKNVEEAELEAEYVLNAIKLAGEYKKNMTLPIAYDVEDKCIKENNLTKDEVTQIILAFCNKIYEAGYTPIIYSNDNYFRNYIDLNMLNSMAYRFWYARWIETDFSDKITIADTKISPFIWQYTQDGNIEGTGNDKGNTDLDIMYMKDRVKVDVILDGQVVDTVGADKGYSLDKYPSVLKKGYKLLRFEDTNGRTIDDNYIFNFDTKINAIFERIGVKGLILENEEINIEKLGEYYINVKSVIPDEAIVYADELGFESDDENIVTVDKNGKIQIVGNGSCNVTCYLLSDKSVKTRCKVNVNVEFQRGDINKDGKINAVDASIVLDKFNNSNATELDIQIADLNGDNKLNSIDASMILDLFNLVQ